MAKGSQGLTKPAESPLSNQGRYQSEEKRGYSQVLHTAGKEIPRSLPYSEDAEKGVLCSLVLSPREVGDLCILRLHPEAFYSPAHKIIYELVIEFSDKSKPIDFITLKQTLKDRSFLEEVGGPEFLNELYTFVPTAANAGYYVDIVREKYLLRRLILACDSLARRCYEDQENVEPLLDDAERQIFEITGDHVKIDVVLTTAASRLAAAKLFIDDTPGLTIAELRAKARRLAASHQIELLVVDYLQLLRSTSRRAQDNRQIEISEISAGIKSLAKELKIPIIVIAQLNRQPDTRAKEGGRPRLSDLRESGSIEQDADLVGLLVRSEYYETDDEAKQEKAGEADLINA